jgi:plasmid maintenance system antidote protein VapI
MGRPAKNPMHPLTRLRAQLSTPNNSVTRQALSKRTGIPVDTIKDIETGRFQLTAARAIKISLATGVDGESLLKGEDPLLDLAGNPVSNMSNTQPDQLWWSAARLESVKLLMSVVLDAAQEKYRTAHLYFLLQGWLSEVSKLLDLLPIIREKLKIGSVHPHLKLPESFYPQSKPERLRWEMILQSRLDEFDKEIVRIKTDLFAQRLPRKYRRLNDLRDKNDRGEELSSREKTEMDTLEDELESLGARSPQQIVELQSLVETSALNRLNATQQALRNFLQEDQASKKVKNKPARR